MVFILPSKTKLFIVFNLFKHKILDCSHIQSSKLYFLFIITSADWILKINFTGSEPLGLSGTLFNWVRGIQTLDLATPKPQPRSQSTQAKLYI